jgi:hypothetical protein
LLPVKLNGSQYLKGELELKQYTHIEQTLYPVEHLYKNWLKGIFTHLHPLVPLRQLL